MRTQTQIAKEYVVCPVPQSVTPSMQRVDSKLKARQGASKFRALRWAIGNESSGKARDPHEGIYITSAIAFLIP